MTVFVRPMRIEDARAFLEVHHAAIRHIAAADYPADVVEAWAPLPISREDIERFLANPDSEVRLVAEVDGCIVGVGAIVLQNSELRACYVAPQVARGGVGTAIVREIERVARDHRLEVLQLDSTLTAEPFYRSLGYVVQERTVHRLSSGPEMASVKMRKDLPTEPAEGDLQAAMNLSQGRVDLAALTVRLRAAFPDTVFDRAALNDEGEDHAVVLLDDAWVFRFARTAGAAGAAGDERRLLAALGPLTDVAVPRYERVADRVAGYRLIRGEPLTEARFAAMKPAARARAMGRLGRFLKALHGLPSETLARFRPPLARDYAHQYGERRARLAQVLPGALIARADAFFAALPAGVATAEAALIHRDLTEDHILVEGEALAGVIDFTDAGVGDPAFDFTFLWAYGPAAIAQAGEAYGASAALLLRSRWWFVRYRLDQIWWSLSGARSYDVERLARDVDVQLRALGL